MIYLVKRADNGATVKATACPMMASKIVGGWAKLGVLCRVVEIKL